MKYCMAAAVLEGVVKVPSHPLSPPSSFSILSLLLSLVISSPRYLSFLSRSRSLIAFPLSVSLPLYMHLSIRCPSPFKKKTYKDTTATSNKGTCRACAPGKYADSAGATECKVSNVIKYFSLFSLCSVYVQCEVFATLTLVTLVILVILDGMQQDVLNSTSGVDE